MACDRRRVCVGDLSDRITIQRRSITEPVFGSADFGEDFDLNVSRWAKISTVRGRTFFSSAGTEQPVTHELTIRFDSAITAESWVLLEDGRRLDILSVEDIDEEHDFMVLTCTDRGSAEASKA